MLALLLARQGIEVRLLESQLDFERAFRGDSIYPTVLEVMDSLGLNERLAAVPHARAQTIRLMTEHGAIDIGRLARLRGRFPYVMVVPQSRFLEFMIEEASRYSNFRLELGARVEGLLEENDQICGVRYRQAGVLHELHANLTVGCDGRGSRVRALSGLESGLLKTAPATDLVWLSVPRDASSPQREEVNLHVGRGCYLVVLEHAQHWQIGLGIPKGHFQQVRDAGIPALCASISELAPWLATPLETIAQWSQVQLLSVQTNRLKRWSKPGLLLLGDAAHTMSPIGGVGINLAIQDAVVAANQLMKPLLENSLKVQHLQAVQHKRDLPVRFTQAWTRLLELQLAYAMKSQPPRMLVKALAWLMRLKVMNDFSTWLIAYGFQAPRVREVTSEVSV
jgi:2-polyprenyl-6-methoxyphenol hydroxylase-like FAD-dependent oxidoreductase